MSTYTLSITLPMPYDATVDAVREALADQGFGVLTEIDLRATLRAKLGVDVPPQVILGACRPPLAHEVAQYDDDVARRLRVRPGMTGLWQVSGRSDLSWSEAIRLDLYYVDNWSMVQDLTILFRTFSAVFSSRGAY